MNNNIFNTWEGIEIAKYTGVTQGKDGSWSYRIKKKVNGQVVDTRIKKDENGMPFLTARAAHEAKLASGEIEIAPKTPKTTLQGVYDGVNNYKN